MTVSEKEVLLVLPPAGSRWWGPLNKLTIAVGQTLLVGGLFTFALTWGYLPGIDPSKQDSAVFAAADRGTGYLVHVGLIMIAMIACAGLPSRQGES